MGFSQITHALKAAYPVDGVFKSSPLRGITDDGTLSPGRIVTFARPRCDYCGGHPGPDRTCRGCGAPTGRA